MWIVLLSVGFFLGARHARLQKQAVAEAARNDVHALEIIPGLASELDAAIASLPGFREIFPQREGNTLLGAQEGGSQGSSAGRDTGGGLYGATGVVPASEDYEGLIAPGVLESVMTSIAEGLKAADVVDKAPSELTEVNPSIFPTDVDTITETSPVALVGTTGTGPGAPVETLMPS